MFKGLKRNEKVMIRAKIEEEAQETQKYIKHILTEFVRHAPLSKGEKIEISVIENKPPFPKIREETDYYKDGKLTIPDANYNTERREIRTEAFIKFNKDRFKELAKFMNPSEVVGNVIRGTLKFEVVNPEKIYKECRKYGVLIPDENALLEVKDPNMAHFDEDKSWIIWRNKIVPIENDTKQYYICQYAFQQPVNKNLSWGDLVENVHEMTDYQRKRARNSIYDAVYKINDKTKELCKKPLFEWESKSFRRLA